MKSSQVIYFTMKDFPALRDYLFKKKMDDIPKEIRKDVETLRKVEQ